MFLDYFFKDIYKSKYPFNLNFIVYKVNTEEKVRMYDRKNKNSLEDFSRHGNNVILVDFKNKKIIHQNYRQKHS